MQITSIGSDRKPSYTRRISLNSKNVETGATDISHSSGSNVSAPPVEIEVLNSDVSSRGLQFAPNESEISSMPPDSMLEGGAERSRIDDDDTLTKDTYLAAPQRRRSRSTSQERITQRVMEKLGQTPVKRRVESDKRRRSAKHHDDDLVSGAESSLLSSNPVSSQRSYQSRDSNYSIESSNTALGYKLALALTIFFFYCFVRYNIQYTFPLQGC